MIAASLVGMTCAGQLQGGQRMARASTFGTLFFFLAVALVFVLPIGETEEGPGVMVETSSVVGIWWDGMVMLDIRPDSTCHYSETVNVPVPLDGSTIYVHEDLEADGRLTAGPDGLCVRMRERRAFDKVIRTWELRVWLDSTRQDIEAWRTVSLGMTQSPHCRGTDTRRFSLGKIETTCREQSSMSGRL